MKRACAVVHDRPNERAGVDVDALVDQMGEIRLDKKLVVSRHCLNPNIAYLIFVIRNHFRQDGFIFLEYSIESLACQKDGLRIFESQPRKDVCAKDVIIDIVDCVFSLLFAFPNLLLNAGNFRNRG